MIRHWCFALALFSTAYVTADEAKPLDAPSTPVEPPAAAATAARGIAFVESRLHFASAEEAGKFLAEEDEYFRALGPMHRGLILKKAGDASLDDLKTHVQSCGRDWTDDEKAAFTAAFAKFAPKAAELKLRLPAEILLIKTNGDEDLGMPYTRRNGIVIPQRVAARSRGAGLIALCAHELFHVYSRFHPEQRDALYAVFGFSPLANPPKPETWDKLRITNPDAPVSRHSFTAKIADGSEVMTIPYLLSKRPAYDPAVGKNAGAYFQVDWLEVPAHADAKARTFSVPDFTNFRERTGGNTNYTIHPEEITADNFMLMITGAKSASPQKLRELEAVLTAPVK